MNKKFYVGSEEHSLREVSEEELKGRSAGGSVWIDVEGFENEELRDWLTSMGFSAHAARAAIGLHGRTRLISLEDEILFELPALASDIGAERVPLGFLCRPGLCVTFHQKPVEGLRATARHLTQETHGPVPDTSSLVAALLAGLTLRAVDAIDSIRRTSLNLQDRMETHPEELDIAEIQDLSGVIRALDSVISERIVIMTRLELIENPTLALRGTRDFASAESDVAYLDRVIDRVEKRVEGIRMQFGLHQQERTNKRLAVLTVLSAVFLPLTLIAGIYGMNFQFMPELGVNWAYPATLGFMVVLAFGMIAWFRAHGWFEE